MADLSSSPVPGDAKKLSFPARYRLQDVAVRFLGSALLLCVAAVASGWVPADDVSVLEGFGQGCLGALAVLVGRGLGAGGADGG